MTTKMEICFGELGVSSVDEWFDMGCDMLGPMDSINIGVCMGKDCDYTTNVEPDNSSGWCDECETNTVRSLSMLAGVI